MFDIPLGEVKFYGYNNSGKRILIKGEIQEGRIGNRYILYSDFNIYLKDEFKAMESARWLGSKDQEHPIKAWGVADSDRNKFQLAYLLGMDPYAPYNGKLPDYMPRRNGKIRPYAHQLEMTSHILTRRQCVIAGEPGVGKTLAAEEAMEASNILEHNWLWIGPRPALDSVKYEFYKWKLCQVCGKLGMHHRSEDHPIIDQKMIHPRFATYEELKKIVETWPKGSPAYKGIIMDECQKVKTPTAQRTQAAQYIADSARHEYGRDAIVCLMTGTPAPKSPSDWYSLCSIACPGFIREGDINKFNRRLALIEKYEGLGGASYPKLVTWWDDENKCAKCGKSQSEPEHSEINMMEEWYHEYKKSINEVEKLYARMSGLVLVKRKDQCLDLPPKIYKQVIVKPTPSLLRAAQLISKTAVSTIRALTLLRELSDGFQYKEVECGVDTCPTCDGRLIIKMKIDLDEPNNPLDQESLTKGHRAIWDDSESDPGNYKLIGFKLEPIRFGDAETDCHQCRGKGVVPIFQREAVRVDCPKDQAVLDLLDEYDEQGRFITWAGFTESVDRCVQLGLKAGWDVVRLDGRGWWSNNPQLMKMNGAQLLEAFDDKVAFPKIDFCGQPGAGGVGLNLTASSVECYFSNTFKFEDRDQSENRIHRPGADHERGCTIIDLIHLPQDLWVLANLKRKRDLQSMSMGVLEKESSKYEMERVA